MIDYLYTARDQSSGSIIKGNIQADNESAAADLLMQKDLVPVKIVPAKNGKVLGIDFSGVEKVKARDRVIFTRQLSTLIKAGLPITQALATAVDQVSSDKFKSILQKVVASVEGGTSLAESFGRFPEVFNHTYVSLVKAGETSGTLDVALERLAGQQEKELAIASKIRGALIYPLLVLGVIILVLGYMLVSVLPQITGLYSDLGKTLPIYTSILLGISQFTINYWWLTILIIVAMVFGVRAYVQSRGGRRMLDKVKLTAPVFGKLFQKVYMARFTRTLGSLVASGVPMLEALDITAESVNNVVIKDIIDGAAQQVKGGKALSMTLSNHKYILPLVPQMIRIGEDSGTLGDMLDKVASFYEDEVDQTVKNLSTIIEPVMMIVLGGLVFFMIAAILLPVYSLVGGGIETNPADTVQTK
jgi:type IV pilus assembly protein PilC